MKHCFIFTCFLFCHLSYGQLNPGKDSISLTSLSFTVYADGNIEKIKETSSGRVLGFAHNLAFVGYDMNNLMYLSAQTYRTNHVDFHPGPVSDDPQSVNTYNRVWKVRASTIADFVNGNLSAIPPSIQDWPAHGNTLHGEPQYLAPFIDTDNDGIYNPANGDYPCIKGTEAIFFMYNDAYRQSSPGMGLEIHGLAYVENIPGTLNDSTLFIEYTIYNRSDTNTAYRDVHIGVFSDFDIGESEDDLVGTEVSQNAVYAYNGDFHDEGAFEYELASMAMVILEGPPAEYFDGMDNDKDGCVDAVINAAGICVSEDPSAGIREHWMLDNSMFYTNSSNESRDDFGFYLRNLCRSGNPKLRGNGDGFFSTANEPLFCGFINRPLTRFMYTGNSFDPSGAYEPSTDKNWFESPAAKEDKRVVASSGAFQLSKNNPVTTKLAYVWHKADSTESAQDAGLGSLLHKAGRVNAQYNPREDCRQFFVSAEESMAAGLFSVRYDFTADRIILRNGYGEKVDCVLYNNVGQEIRSLSVEADSRESLPFRAFKPGLMLLLNKHNQQFYKVYIPQP